MRSIKTVDLRDAMEVLANAYAEMVKDSYFLGFAEEIGQGDPRHREIIDLSLRVSAAMVTLRGNDKGRRGKAEAPPDPYGGKVLPDGRIEYMDRDGKIRAIDPNGEIAGFKRGDVVRFCCRSSTDLVLGTGPTNFLANALWIKDGEGRIGFYNDGESLSLVSRASSPPLNPYMAGLVEGGVR